MHLLCYTICQDARQRSIAFLPFLLPLVSFCNDLELRSTLPGPSPKIGLRSPKRLQGLPTIRRASQQRMSFVQASPLSERPRDLLNQRNSARLFGTPVCIIISRCCLSQCTYHLSLNRLLLHLSLSKSQRFTSTIVWFRKAPNENLQANNAWRNVGDCQACLGQPPPARQRKRTSLFSRCRQKDLEQAATDARVTCKQLHYRHQSLSRKR